MKKNEFIITETEHYPFYDILSPGKFGIMTGDCVAEFSDLEIELIVDAMSKFFAVQNLLGKKFEEAEDKRLGF